MVVFLNQRGQGMIRLCASLFFLMSFVFPSVSHAALSIDLKKTGTAQGVSICDLTVAGEGVRTKKKVYLINENHPAPKKILWLFHGFKPEGDPYAQSPMEFILRWDLVRFCKKNDYMLIAPDMGATLYPMDGFEDAGKISDMRWLKEAFGSLVFEKHKRTGVVLIGVSTGVEGSIKFASVISNFGVSADSIVAFSGTYDFFTIDQGTGEYRIHKYLFGEMKDNLNVWRSENPMESLKRLSRTRLYLYCESNSIYRKQAEDLRDQRLANIEIADMLNLGKGFSHSWTFWGNPAVVKSLHSILLQ